MADSRNKTLEAILVALNGQPTSEAWAIVGYADFSNAGADQTLLPNTYVDLLNDKLGPTTVNNQMPSGIALDVAADGRIKLTGMSVGDQIFVRHEFKVTPQTNNQTITFKNDVGTTVYPLGTHTHKMEQGGGVTTDAINPLTWVYIGNANTLGGGIMPRIKSTGPATVKYSGCAISILKRKA